MDDYKPLSPPVFHCEECGKKYQSEESLNRHKNIHSVQVRYVCHICKATFLRSDVLSRHFKIHKGKINDSNDKSLLGRKRSQRACKSCRASKIKCNSGNPCSSCIKSGNKCIYVKSPGTVKHSLMFDSTSNDDSIPDEKSEDVDGIDVDNDAELSAQEALIELSQENSISPESNPQGSVLVPAPVPAPVAISHVPEQISQPSIPHDNAIISMDQDLTNDILSNHLEGIPNIWCSTADWSWMYEYNQFLPPSIIPTTPSTTSHLDMLESDTKSAVPNNPTHLVEYLIQTAIANIAPENKSSIQSSSIKDEIWYRLSEKIEAVFHLEDWRSRIEDSSRHYPHILYRFMTLYFDKFNLVFAFFWRHGFDFDNVPPLLCLTLGMVGAMFDGEHASKYGSILHDQLCPTLAKIFLVVAEQDDQYIPLLVATLVTQIIAVYSGNPQRLIYAQQISGVLITQARRLNLFSSTNNTFGGGTTDGDISQWIRLETRKRIAFAIFLNDTYLSMLMNSRPLVSPEEMNIELPCSDELWSYKGSEWRKKIATAILKEKERPRMFFSDLYRILLDKDELLGSLEPQEYRMLLLSMQQQVWRFSNDPEMFRRLCGNEETYEEILGKESNDELLNGGKFYRRLNNESIYNNDHLNIGARKMQRLKGEFVSTCKSLNKWRLSFSSNTQKINNLLDRQVILSSQVTYHSLFIVLNCPVNIIHNIANNPTANLMSGSNQFKIAFKWSRSEQSKIAVTHIKEIWNILNEELRLQEKDRAFFNIASPIGVYHSAIVLWVYLYFLKSGENHNNRDSVISLGGYEIKPANGKYLLESFGKLMRHISQGGLGVSYARHINELANRTM